MKRSKLLDTSLFAAAFVGIVVLLNVLALNAFVRVDLTKDRQYTLSEASRDAVSGLGDRLTVKAYFSRELPPPYSANARYVKDLLDEYYAASTGQLSYEFLDPAAEETEADKEKRKEVKQDIFGRAIRAETDVERELRSLGIQPVEVRVNEGDRFEAKRVYMGISLRYGDKQEVIPVVTDTRSLEYDLTTLIRKLARSKVPKVALVTGRGGLDQREELSTLLGLLEQQYQVEPLDLAGTAEVPADVDALIVTGPEQPFTADESAAIDRFIRSGKSAAFLLDAVRVDLRTTQYQPAEHGLGTLLDGYGVRFAPGLLLDAQCAAITVTEQRGFMRINHPVQYPYVPVVRQLDQEQPLTRGLAEVTFPFVSALEVNAAAGVKADVLVSSSPESWTQPLPVDLNPLQRWPATITFTGPHPLVVALSGIGNGGRALVIGGSSLIQNQFFGGSGQALALNLVDWLLLDEAMMAIRSRGLTVAPLPELSDTMRTTLKYLNILGVPALLVAAGLVRWRLRERRRRSVRLEEGTA
jgi:gliding-associated putative ABC transporter substrate-binding component GldG